MHSLLASQMKAAESTAQRRMTTVTYHHSTTLTTIRTQTVNRSRPSPKSLLNTILLSKTLPSSTFTGLYIRRSLALICSPSRSTTPPQPCLPPRL